MSKISSCVCGVITKPDALRNDYQICTHRRKKGSYFRIAQRNWGNSYEYQVVCHICGLSGQMFDKKHQAIEQWNKMMKDIEEVNK